jgi:hypothetical protein
MKKLKKLSYQPHTWALKHLHNNSKKRIVLVLARRSGKTVACVNHLIRSALISNGIYAYVAPYQKQAKRVAWDMFKQYLHGVSVEYNEAELSIKFPNKSKIYVLGADNSEGLRGLGLKGVVLDEIADMDADFWGKVVSPMLAKGDGYAIFIGTVKGKNHFYKMYINALKDNDWHAALLDTYQAGNLSTLEIAKQKKDLSEEQFEQEFMCNFNTAIFGAIYSRELKELRGDGRITKVPYDPNFPIYTFWDVGFSDKTAIIWVQKANNAYYIVDCFEANGLTIKEYVEVVKVKPYKVECNYLPHDAQHKTLANGGISILDQVEALGLVCEIVPAPKNKMNAISATRMRLKSCYIDDTKCAVLLDYLAMYQWKDGMISERVPLHNEASHMCDALSYFAMTQINDRLSAGGVYGVEEMDKELFNYDNL